MRIIFISITAAKPLLAWQLHCVICGNATPTKTCLAVLKHYILPELSQGVCGHREKNEYSQQFIVILHVIQDLNVSPNTADQIELIHDNQVNAWLCLIDCANLSIACVLYSGSDNHPYGGNHVCPNTPLDGHYRNYLTPNQFDLGEFYNKLEFNFELEEDITCGPKHRSVFPRCPNGWEKTIRCNDPKINRSLNHSQEVISRAHL